MKRLALLAIAGLTSCEQGSSVSRNEFERNGKIWPLTVGAAKIGCDGVSKWVEVDGIRYGINGLARARGYPGMEPIWAVDRQATLLSDASVANPRGAAHLSDFDLNAAADKLCD